MSGTSIIAKISMSLIELTPLVTELVFHTPVPANKIEFFVHSTTHDSPYIHPSHDSILELWQAFPNGVSSSWCPGLVCSM